MGALHTLFLRKAAHLQTQSGVLLDRLPRHQAEILQNQRRFEARRFHGLAIDEDASAGGALQAARRKKARRFAAS